MQRHHRAYWVSLGAALLITVAGVVLVVAGSGSPEGGPAAAVLRYFADLQAGNAAGALAAGHVPPGRRTYLTAAVLAEQQGIAAIHDVAADSTVERGHRAVVHVRYDVGSRATRASIRLRERDGRWLLARVAVPVVVRVHPAADRALLAGRGLPAGPVLLFPGAVPVSFDTPFLSAAPAAASVGFRSGPELALRARVTRRGRSAAIEALGGALRQCLRTPAAGCPQPSGRVVPGTVRGGLVAPTGGPVQVTLGPSRAGVLDISGRFRTPLHFQRLDFRDRPQPVAGTFTLPVHARAYAVAPLRLVWRP